MLKAIDTRVRRSEERTAKATSVARSRLLACSSAAKVILKSMDALVPSLGWGIARDILVAWCQQLKSGFNAKVMTKVIENPDGIHHD